MALEDIIEFQLKRINPFQGLIIDADTWQDAHNYHRAQQRLHLLAFHSTGIIQGLEVTASSPPDLSVVIHPGIAVDSEGNIIIVPQKQRYQLQTRQKGIIYLVIQFREIPSGPYQPAEAGQPTRILEAYRIQEREKLPAEPHLELARIDFDSTLEVIKDAESPSKPAKNEIILSFRKQLTSAALDKTTTPAVVVSHSQETLTVAHAVLGEASKDLHCAGLRNLVREVNRQNNLVVNLEENVTLDENIDRFSFIYLTGNGRFELAAEQQAALVSFLKSGGLIFGDGCSEEAGEARGAKEFGLAFNQLASKLNCKLEVVQRGHSLLSALYLFSEVPQGAEPAMLLEGGQMVCSGSDYGCAWHGGYQDKPLPRDIIRNSLEMGANITAYAHKLKSGTG
ncbi:MAG TPA: DUF4159 domain-containing protein [Dehalococcoidia bacterium]|nr:DUF4159 domain-containing protein [Dehalococcoidia bacterium]